MSIHDDQDEKDEKKRQYLISKKRYIACDGCGTLIAPNDFGYDVAMCQNCQAIEMKDPKEWSK